MKIGNEVFLEALKHYKITSQYRFSTYSTWWIKKYIETALRIGARSILEEELYQEE